jgi:hypothetical protein
MLVPSFSIKGHAGLNAGGAANLEVVDAGTDPAVLLEGCDRVDARVAEGGEHDPVVLERRRRDDR